MTTLYDSGVLGWGSERDAGPEYLPFGMRLEEEEEADVDDIEKLKKLQRERPDPEMPERREPDQNSQEKNRH